MYCVYSYINLVHAIPSREASDNRDVCYCLLHLMDHPQDVQPVIGRHLCSHFTGIQIFPIP